MINPFEFDGAPNLAPEQIKDWFIDDYNYARFIQSSRNVLLLGQRGSGKSMTLMYFSLPIQQAKYQSENTYAPLKYLGIYIPCNTPLTHKREYLLFDDPIKPAALSEHYLVLGIALSITDSLEPIAARFSSKDTSQLSYELSDLFNILIDTKQPLIRQIRKAITKELRQTQELVNAAADSDPEFQPKTFYTYILPLLNALKETELLRETHFLLMIDDAHDLNSYQQQILNSWLSYRDHSVFSLKVAIAKVTDYQYKTASGGTILEGHDYISIDLEQPFQNADSRFGKLARDIICRRLEIAGITVSPENFFPESPEFRQDLDKCNAEAEEIAKKSLNDPSPKAIADFRYKYGRAFYYRSRSSKANRPVYSGLDSIIHLSTGVIRNFLDPCYWMYDDIVSKSKDNELITVVPPNVQSDVILRRSEQMWERLRRGLDIEIEGCTSDQATKLTNLFENLAKLFRDRLLNHHSEPRVVTFTVSGSTPELEAQIRPLFTIARRAQLLYVRSGPSKDDGLREDYYTPNRMLWPVIGLDAHGQHGRISLPAAQIVAASLGTPFPLIKAEASNSIQGDLF